MKNVSTWKFWLFKWWFLPAAGFMGVRLVHLSDQDCRTSLHLGWRNKNPFRSLYFAAQSSAAEMATGLPAFQIVRAEGKGISMLITGMEASFFKKATGEVEFTCNDIQAIKKAIHSALNDDTEATVVKVQVQAIQKADAQLVSTFTFHWSFKKRA